MKKRYEGFLVKYPEKVILKYEGYIIPSSIISQKPFKIELNTNNPINDKEAERISKVIIKMLNKGR